MGAVNLFNETPSIKKPFSNGSGNPAITYGYNINNYNNPFGNPSTSLGLEGSVTLPNYQNVFSYDLAAAFTAAQQNGSLQSNAVILDPGNISGPVSSERAKEISDSSQELIKNTFSQKQIQAMLGNTVTEERAKQIADLAQLTIPETVNKIKKSTIKPSFSEKFSNSTFGKDFDKWSQGLNIANNLFTTFAGEKSEYSGTKGGLVRGIDSVYDTAQSASAMFGSIGQFASLIMGGNKLLGNVANKLGAGTDGRTTIDAILNSSFLQLTPFGMINGLGGKKTMSFTKNNLAFAQVGSGYTGTNAKVDKAVDLADKKFGLLSLGDLDEANDKIIDAGGEQRIMANIADTASDRFALSDSMAAINNSRMALNLMGNYDQSSVRVGKAGMILQLAREINSKPSVLKEITEIPEEFLEVPEFKEGGQIISQSILQEVTEIPTEFLEIDEFKKGGKFNIIPEGALHARKHNMDVENITQKGIPVVSESADGEIVQQAEIERQEIIFRLEVTKKLEELAKDGSDEAAIEAGKLLVQEILYNTIDNTNTLL